MGACRTSPRSTGCAGVAVAIVVAFHLGHLQGGFLGVDLFFVLSGLPDHVAARRRAGAHDGRVVLRRLLGPPGAAPAARHARSSSRRWRSTPAGGPTRSSSRTSGATASPRSATSPTGTSSRPTSTTGTRCGRHRRCCTRGAWRSRSSSTWCGRCWSAASRCWPAGAGHRRMRRLLTTLLVVTLALTVASVTATIVLHGADDSPLRTYLGTDTRASSLLMGGGGGPPLRPPPPAGLGPHGPACSSASASSPLAGLAVAWFAVERARRLALRGRAGRCAARRRADDRRGVGGTDRRPRRARCRSARCASSASSATGSTCGTGRSSSWSTRCAPASTACRSTCCASR